MDLTPEEKAFVEPYLQLRPSKARYWVVGLILGLVVCGLGLVLLVADRENYYYWPVVIVAGLIVVEQSWNYRDRMRLLRIVQKYDAIVQRLKYPEEAEDTM